MKTPKKTSPKSSKRLKIVDSFAAEAKAIIESYQNILNKNQIKDAFDQVQKVNKIIQDYQNSPSHLKLREFLKEQEEKSKLIKQYLEPATKGMAEAKAYQERFIDKPVIMNRPIRSNPQEDLNMAIEIAVIKAISAIQSEKAEQAKAPGQIAMTLDSNDDLFYGTFKYSLSGGRLKTVYSLSKAGNYVATEQLRLMTSYKTAGSLRKGIEEINRKANQNLKLSKGNLIIGRANSGYRINENYFIKLT